ncbi:hypothetical protein IAD21_03903 [Abditibacteriota bacterium]|nr:hypothetical protein IAD21_03903 [Abditibacteriota bacterium]
MVTGELLTEGVTAEENLGVPCAQHERRQNEAEYTLL